MCTRDFSETTLFFFKGKRHLFKAVFTCVGLWAVLSAVSPAAFTRLFFHCFDYPDKQ